MAEKKITIRTIAELCGVSVSTVSLAINNKPGVRPGVRELIRKTIEDLGWRCNNLGSRLGGFSEGESVALIANPWLLTNYGGHPVQSTMAKLIEKFEEQGIIPAVYYGRSLEALENCLKSRPAAVVVFSNNFLLKGAIERLLEAGIRVLIAHAEWRDAICPRVHSDHVGAGRLAGRKLREAGCVRPAFFGGFGSYVHCPELKAFESPMPDYFAGIRESYSEFDFRTDAVGDVFGDTTEVVRMLVGGTYDGWIFQLRQYFECFAFLRERVPETVPVRAMITFDTADRPSYPVSRHGCLAENSRKIAELIFELATAVETPEPLEYTVPYLWRAAEKDYGSACVRE